VKLVSEPGSSPFPRAPRWKGVIVAVVRVAESAQPMEASATTVSEERVGIAVPVPRRKQEP